MDDRSIDRTNLESPVTESNSPDPALESFYRQQLQQLYVDPSLAFAAHGGTESDTACGTAAEQIQAEEADGYEFNLFTRSSASGLASVGTSNGPQRITLRSPSPADDGLGCTSGGRPDNYYFTGDTGLELAKQYTQAAVSGQDVIEGLKKSWRGMELPWRVTVIKTTEADNPMELKHQSQVQANRRKRSGKKRRIVIRRRLEARAAREVVARQNHAEKEAAEREKRTRRNREKKVKRKQKDKLKKINDVQDPV